MEAPNKPQWYGAAIANATNFSRDIPWQGGDGGGREGEQGFPQWLRDVMEPHIEKCRRKRADAVETASEEARRRPWWGEWDTDSFPTERNVAWETAGHDLRGAFCEATGCGIELERVHEVQGLKDEMLVKFTDRGRNLAFQHAYDGFVRDVIAPLILDMCGDGTIYYQAFPCVRVVRPGDFSIGPHADCAYGHSPASINIYLPLTRLYGSNALFIESCPGREDWHPIEGGYGCLKAFNGGACAHWTTENHTESTRVSIDFRVITGSRWLEKGWSKRDTFSSCGGYYSTAALRDGVWVREGEGKMPAPDARTGYPFTNPPPRRT